MPRKEGYLKKNITAEKKFADIAMGLALKPDTVSKPDKPIIMLKRIGSTTYEVAVHFSETGTVK